MSIHDISITIQESLVTWQDSETSIIQEWMGRIGENGSESNGSRITIGSHTGTHLDAPLHFIKDGNTVDKLDLDDLIGPCQVVEFGDLDHLNVDASDLEAAGIDSDTTRLLLKTSNSRKGLMHQPKFVPPFVAISPDGAEWCVEHGIRTVGVDYLSVGSPVDGTGHDTHRILLGAGLVALEGLVLDDIKPGKYTLIALPLKIAGAEGCPIRAVLIDI